MAREFSMEIAECIKKHLDDNDWKYHFDETSGLFRFGLNVGHPLGNVRYNMSINRKGYTVIVCAPVSADADDSEMMTTIGEFLHRANFGLKNGNFEIDYEDGEIRYKVYVDCDDQLPSDEVIHNSLGVPGAIFARYGKGVTGIVFQNMSAKDAIVLCEGEGDSDDFEESEHEAASADDLADAIARIQEAIKALDDECAEDDEEQTA